MMKSLAGGMSGNIFCNGNSIAGLWCDDNHPLRLARLLVLCGGPVVLPVVKNAGFAYRLRYHVKVLTVTCSIRIHVSYHL